MAHIIPDINEIKNAVKSAILEIEAEKTKRAQNQKVLTINQVAKRLGRAHQTVAKLIRAGYIETTASGHITEAAVNKYLMGK